MNVERPDLDAVRRFLSQRVSEAKQAEIYRVNAMRMAAGAGLGYREIAKIAGYKSAGFVWKLVRREGGPLPWAGDDGYG
jgi:hypothetical protein